MSCNNCDSSEVEIVFPAGTAQKNQIVKCRKCGLMYAYPMLIDNISRYVSGGASEALTVQSPSVVRSFHKLPDYEAIGLQLGQLLPAGGALLEVGCYAGALLQRFRSQGWGVSGIEPDPVAAHFARAHYGLDVDACTLETSQYKAGSFDAIVMLHVIEHLDDPASAIKIMARLLRNCGYVVIETPIYDTFMFRLLGRRERSMSCDGHVFFYTTATLRALLEQHGFEIVSEKRVGRTVSIGRMLWNIGVMSKSNLIQRTVDWANVKVGLLDSATIYLNCRDMVRVFARKTAQSSRDGPSRYGTIVTISEMCPRRMAE